MAESNVALNVVSIVIGVLIVRIIFSWFVSAKYYVESRIYVDPDQSEADYKAFRVSIVGALAVTGMAGFIIILILSTYINFTSLS